jgi:hypothetical protein
MVVIPEDRMPEAEVALRFAIWLLSLPEAEQRGEVGIDGSAARVFPVRAFLEEEGWRCVEAGGRSGASPPYPQPEESRFASIAADEKTPYGEGINRDTNKVTRGQPENLTDTTVEGKDFSQLPPEHPGSADEPAPGQSSDPLLDATLFPDNEVETKNTIPSIEEAALALHACVPAGEKVQRERLLLDAARELGHTKLTKKVRRPLNKALNAEHNKRRLKTDWQLVWKPRKK